MSNEVRVRVRRRVRPEKVAEKLPKNSSLLNRAYTKRMILDMAKTLRPAWPAERVGQESLDWLEGRLKAIIRDGLMHHPSVGKTIYLNR